MNGEIINSVTKLHLVGYFYWVILRCTDPWILKTSLTEFSCVRFSNIKFMATDGSGQRRMGAPNEGGQGSLSEGHRAKECVSNINLLRAKHYFLNLKYRPCRPIFCNIDAPPTNSQLRPFTYRIRWIASLITLGTRWNTRIHDRRETPNILLQFPVNFESLAKSLSESEILHFERDLDTPQDSPGYEISVQRVHSIKRNTCTKWRGKPLITVLTALRKHRACLRPARLREVERISFLKFCVGYNLKVLNL
jgi:hypothetical protein